MVNIVDTIQNRFFKKVSKQDNGCWIWTGSKNKMGYGCFKNRCITKQLAHQVSFILFKGDIPPKCFVLHACDIPACVNPDHLWIGEPKDNTKDMQIKRRDGNRKLTEEDVINIRKLFKKVPHKKLAEIYNVKIGNISTIGHRHTWKHVP